MKNSVDMKKVESFLNYYDCASPSGVQKLIDTWANNKKDLFDMLGGLKVERDVKFQATEDETKGKIGSFTYNNSILVNGGMNSILQSNPWEDTINNLCTIESLDRVGVPVDWYKPGMKLSGVLGRLVTNPDNTYSLRGKTRPRKDAFDILFSELIQSLKERGKVVLSVDPLDYLTISMNNSGWRSCMAPDGEYRAGTLAYLVDKATVVAYMYSGKQVSYPFGSHNSKTWRQLIYVNPKESTAIFSHHYPRFIKHATDEAKAIVKECMVEYNELKDFTWMISTRASTISSKVRRGSDLYYSDIGNSDCYRIMLKGAEPAEVVVGDIIPCPNCSYGTVRSYESLSCDKCTSTGTVICENCGDRVGRDAVYDVDGDFFCPCCYEDLFVACVKCGETIGKDDARYSEDTDYYYCDSCFDKTHVECDLCGDMHSNEHIHEAEVGGKTIDVCEGCLDTKFVDCCICDKPIHEKDARELNGETMCSACHEKHILVCPKCNGQFIDEDGVTGEDGNIYCCDKCAQEGAE